MVPWTGPRKPYLYMAAVSGPCGRVVPRPVVIQAGPVVLPLGKLEGVGGREARDGCFAEGGVGIGRGSGPATVGKRERAAEGVEIAGVAFRAALLDCVKPVIEDAGALAVDRLGGPSPQRVIGEGGIDRGAGEGGQAVPSIPGVGGGAIRIGLGEEIAVGIEGLGRAAEDKLAIGRIMRGCRDRGRQAGVREAAAGGQPVAGGVVGEGCDTGEGIRPGEEAVQGILGVGGGLLLGIRHGQHVPLGVLASV